MLHKFEEASEDQKEQGIWVQGQPWGLTGRQFSAGAQLEILNLAEPSLCAH